MLCLTWSSAVTQRLKKNTLKNYIYHEKLHLRGQVFQSWALSGYDSSLAQISWVTKRRTQLAGDSAEGLVQTLWLPQSLWMWPDGNVLIFSPPVSRLQCWWLYTPRGLEKLFLLGRAGENTERKNPNLHKTSSPWGSESAQQMAQLPPRSSFGQLEIVWSDVSSSFQPQPPDPATSFDAIWLKCAQETIWNINTGDGKNQPDMPTHLFTSESLPGDNARARSTNEE